MLTLGETREQLNNNIPNRFHVNPTGWCHSHWHQKLLIHPDRTIDFNFPYTISRAGQSRKSWYQTETEENGHIQILLKCTRLSCTLFSKEILQLGGNFQILGSTTLFFLSANKYKQKKIHQAKNRIHHVYFAERDLCDCHNCANFNTFSFLFLIKQC